MMVNDKLTPYKQYIIPDFHKSRIPFPIFPTSPTALLYIVPRHVLMGKLEAKCGTENNLFKSFGALSHA